MSKKDKNLGRAVFYKPITDATEIRSGYLHKSPPKKVLKSEWRRRFFVLFKISENEYQLRYYRSAEEKANPIGGIDLSQISLLYGHPQHHRKWPWVLKSFKCSPSCVLYIRAGSRDYFLVGETSSEIDLWFHDLFRALKNRPHKFLDSEEIINGQPTADIISNPLQQRKNSAPEVGKAPFLAKSEGFNNERKISVTFSLHKIRSVSDPSSNRVDGSLEELEDVSRRPVSEPVDVIFNSDYDYPKSYLMTKGTSVEPQAASMESLYESMTEFKAALDASQACAREVEAVPNSTLMRSITEVYAKFQSKSSPQASDEMSSEDGEDKCQSSDSSCSSSSVSPVEVRETSGLEKQKSSESLDRHTPEEKEFMVNKSDLKKHLTLTEVDGRPSVSGWTGQPQSVCLFHKGDQVLAINDLHTDSVEEFNMFISKTLKTEVKVTILRQRGCQPLHLPNSPCSD